MGKRFVIADTHFGCSYDDILINMRPFSDVSDHDETLIRRWNSVVTNQDTVYVLGDFIIQEDSVNDDGKSYVDYLNGKIVLIRGNHDDNFINFYYDPVGKELCFPTEKLEIVNYPIIVDDFYIFSHYPMFTNSNIPYANIYGHIHGDTKYKDVDKRGMCVSAERINYTPIDFEVVKSEIRSLNN